MIKNTPKKIFYTFLIFIFFVSLIIIGAEYYLRTTSIQYPIQVFRENHNLSITPTKWGPIWSSKKSNRFKTGCKSIQDPVVLIQGSSILYGSETRAEESFAFWIAKELEELRGHRVCILNQAVSGFTFSNQYASAKTLPQDIKPVVTLWEIWHNSPHQFVHVGSAVYNFGSRSPEYIPDPFHLGSLNKWLLSKSYSYEFLLLYGYKPPRIKSNKWEHFVQTSLPKMQEWSQQKNTRLLLASFPAADKPFSEQLITNDYGILIKEIQNMQQNRIPMIDITAVLEDKRETFFADKCCHYTFEGTKAVSKILARFIHQHWPAENQHP